MTAALSGQEINHSRMGRELGLTPQTAGRWLALLAAMENGLQIDEGGYALPWDVL